MSKYAIWNKKDPIYTPVGEVLTAEQWIERFPIAGVESITVICASGEINGAYFGTLGSLVDQYTRRGCDFSACETAEEKIDLINAYEDEQDAASLNAGKQPSAEERTANALEALASGQTTENVAALNALLTGEE